MKSLYKQAITFFDGQNLYHAAKQTFGYSYPNFDPLALSKSICERHDWNLKQVRFYTGIPGAHDNPLWNKFWAAKLLNMSRQGIYVFSRPLRYRHKHLRMDDGSYRTLLTGEEKGIDVRIALDVIRMAHHNEYDVAIIFSQDQDLSEVAKEIRAIATEQSRWIKVASAFPSSNDAVNKRGINATDWIEIDKTTYDSCLDARDYRI
jgi:uncharacterized LabA/DUF88 family protein